MAKIDRKQIKMLAAVVASRQITSFHTSTFEKIGTKAKKLQGTFKIIVRLYLNRQLNDFEQRFRPFDMNIFMGRMDLEVVCSTAKKARKPHIPSLKGKYRLVTRLLSKFILFALFFIILPFSFQAPTLSYSGNSTNTSPATRDPSRWSRRKRSAAGSILYAAATSLPKKNGVPRRSASQRRLTRTRNDPSTNYTPLNK